MTLKQLLVLFVWLPAAAVGAGTTPSSGPVCSIGISTPARRFPLTRYESRTENETHSYVQLKGSLVKIWKEIELTGSLLVTNQSSKSGYEEYMAFSLPGFVSRTF